MIRCLFILMSCFVYGSSLIEPCDGWTFTPVHQFSPVLKARAGDRPIFGIYLKNQIQYTPGAGWIRKHGEKCFLHAFKDGVLYQYDLSNERAWKHDPMTLQDLKSFAASTYDYFSDYLCKNYDRRLRSGVLNGCVAAVRDAESYPVEPIGGGWSFAFPRQGIFDYRVADIGGDCSKDRNGRYTFSVPPSRQHAGDVWLRYCGKNLYAYAPLSCGVLAYNVSCNKKLYVENQEIIVSSLKNFAEKGTLPTDDFNYQLFFQQKDRAVNAVVYGVNAQNIMQVATERAAQPHGWKLIPLKTKCAGDGAMPPLTEKYLKKRKDDRIIDGVAMLDGIFRNASTWLRYNPENHGCGVLCAWYGGIFFEFDLSQKEAWHHLPETFSCLEGFAQSHCDTFDEYLSDDDVYLAAMKNGCEAAVRDCVFSSVEAKNGWSLTDMRMGVFDYQLKDKPINQAVDMTFPEWAVWGRICGERNYLCARVHNRLCQFNLSSDEELWGGSKDVLFALQKLFMSDKFYGKGAPKMTKYDATLIKNGAISAICNALYKDNTVHHTICGWTLSKPHPILFTEGYAECLLAGGHAMSVVVASKREYRDQAIWWRFDGNENLCFRTNNLLLQYNLKHVCNDTCAHQRLKELLAKNHKELQIMHACVAEKSIDAHMILGMDECQKSHITQMMQEVASILESHIAYDMQKEGV